MFCISNVSFYIILTKINTVVMLVFKRETTLNIENVFICFLAFTACSCAKEMMHQKAVSGIIFGQKENGVRRCSRNSFTILVTDSEFRFGPEWNKNIYIYLISRFANHDFYGYMHMVRENQIFFFGCRHHVVETTLILIRSFISTQNVLKAALANSACKTHSLG